MKKNNYTKTQNLLKFIFLFVVFLGIGYAFLEANLNINGDVTVSAPELNVYVQSTAVTEGSTPGTPTIIGNDKKEVDFTTALTNDGNSFFEETTTVINKGSKKAYLLSVSVKVYDSSNNEITLEKPYEYKIIHGDGTPVQNGETLNVNSTESFKIKFNYRNGTDMSDVTYYPSFTFKIIYNYVLELPLICDNNENITALSTNKCTANENITIPEGTVCKRAINLHQEECTSTNTSYFCSKEGFTPEGSKGTSTITYGYCGTSGTLTSGDAFTCDVNGDGEFDELLERFYYVSDYYDTTTKTYDSTTGVLIYYNSVVEGVSCNKSYFAYDLSCENWHGPEEKIKSQLPTTKQWTNVSLKNTIRAILDENGGSSIGTNLFPTNYSYSGFAARFITYQEAHKAVSDAGGMDNSLYLAENTGFSGGPTIGYWLENPWSNTHYGNQALVLDSHMPAFGNSYNAVVYAYTYYGARPAIDVPKNKMSY